MYSPAAIDKAPAVNAAIPVNIKVWLLGCAAATPTNKLAVEISPSLAPNTAALNQ